MAHFCIGAGPGATDTEFDKLHAGATSMCIACLRKRHCAHCCMVEHVLKWGAVALRGYQQYCLAAAVNRAVGFCIMCPLFWRYTDGCSSVQ